MAPGRIRQCNQEHGQACGLARGTQCHLEAEGNRHYVKLGGKSGKSKLSCVESQSMQSSGMGFSLRGGGR